MCGALVSSQSCRTRLGSGLGGPRGREVRHRIRSEMSRPEHPARPHLASGNRGPRAQTFAQLGPGSHSDSASESARKPGVPSSQDLLGPRRQAGRPEAGHNVTPPPGRGDCCRSSSATSGPPPKGRGFRAGRDLTECFPAEGGTWSLKGVGGVASVRAAGELGAGLRPSVTQARVGAGRGRAF